MTGGGREARTTGFTLVEVIVVIAISAILLSLAIPSFQQYLLRGHRAEAVHSLLAVAGCQERIRAATGYYDTTRCSREMDSKTYRISLSPANQREALAFVATATPGSAENGDYCGSLSIDQAGTRSIEGELKFLSACWGGR